MDQGQPITEAVANEAVASVFLCAKCGFVLYSTDFKLQTVQKPQYTIKSGLSHVPRGMRNFEWKNGTNMPKTERLAAMGIVQ